MLIPAAPHSSEAKGKNSRSPSEISPTGESDTTGTQSCPITIQTDGPDTRYGIEHGWDIKEDQQKHTPPVQIFP